MMTKTYRPNIDDVRGDKDWTPAEVALLASCETGYPASIGSELPTEPGDKVIRANLIRYLLLGGCDSKAGKRPHPKGVEIYGAWIEGELDFEGCETSLTLLVRNSYFTDTPILMDSRIRQLNLNGSRLPSLDGHRIRVDSSVLLTGSFEATGLVDLSSARIKGTLDCSGGTYSAKSGRALDCDSITIGADVFLRDGFRAKGEANLTGAMIAGQLSCVGGTFSVEAGRALNCFAITVGADVFMFGKTTIKGGLDLRRAKVGGNLSCQEATINGLVAAVSMSVGATLRWTDMQGNIELLDLEDAKVGKMEDDADSWKVVKAYDLRNFRYGALEGVMTVSQRIGWLARNYKRRMSVAQEKLAVADHPWRELPDGALTFEPQPYTQLASELHRQGHRRAAARVLYEREKHVRQSEHQRSRARLDGSVREGFSSLKADILRPLDWAFGKLFGYGHRPLNALVASLVLIGLASVFYGMIYSAGQMAPNSDVILTSVDWLAAIKEGCPLITAPDYAAKMSAGCQMPLTLWDGRATGVPMSSAGDYETFSAGLYGLDLFVPLDALGQENAWAPSKDRGTLGYVGYYARWMFQFMGWVITAVGAATLTGLVGRRE